MYINGDLGMVYYVILLYYVYYCFTHINMYK